jgi:DNA-binding SARP family transcriptional activator
VDIRVLGNVEIHHNDGVLGLPRGGVGGARLRQEPAPPALPRAGERCVLATLALAPRSRVQVDTLVAHLWGDDPPENAERTVATYVRTVRRAVERAGGGRDWVRNHRPGAYELDIDPELVDHHRFTRLVKAARARQDAGDGTGAVVAYQQAVALRRGEALAGVPGGWASNWRWYVEREFVEVLCALYEQQLALGGHTEVATNVAGLITQVVPTDRMILLGAHALAGSGQHAAIRDFYRRAAVRMAETAHARPSAEVHAMVRQLVARPAAPLPPPPPAAAPPPVAPRPPAAARNVTMVAQHSGTVYQSAGDQYIGPAAARDEFTPRRGRPARG